MPPVQGIDLFCCSLPVYAYFFSQPQNQYFVARGDAVQDNPVSDPKWKGWAGD